MPENLKTRIKRASEKVFLSSLPKEKIYASIILPFDDLN
jgi:hypothetical protein